MTESRPRSRAEVLLARAVLQALKDVDVGATIVPDPASDICSCVERFVPEVLAWDFPEWNGESLDGVFVIRGSKVDTRRLQLLGTAILISDQRVTPLFVEIEPSESGDAIARYTMKVGEPGEGPLHISGPPCNSGAATRLLHRLPNRQELGRVDWVYTASADEAE